MDEAYAVQFAAELVIEYLKTNTNRWPRNWGELRTANIGDDEYFRGSEKETGGYRSFLDDLQRKVDVNFSVTTPQLVQSLQSQSGFPTRVIWLRNGRRTHWNGLEPNEMVAEYLRKYGS